MPCHGENRLIWREKNTRAQRGVHCTGRGSREGQVRVTLVAVVDYTLFGAELPNTDGEVASLHRKPHGL